MEYMGIYVFPKMREVFRAFDDKAYGSFRCQTCHGPDMETVSFKMPNGLYALPTAGAEQAALEYDEKTATFMIQKVVPAMRDLMAKNDPDVGRTFGCQNCHPKE
jgi:hypothetical protein